MGRVVVARKVVLGASMEGDEVNTKAKWVLGHCFRQSCDIDSGH